MGSSRHPGTQAAASASTRFQYTYNCSSTELRSSVMVPCIEAMLWSIAGSMNLSAFAGNSCVYMSTAGRKEIADNQRNQCNKQTCRVRELGSGTATKEGQGL